MIKIVDGKIWRDGQKIGWIDGVHVRAENNEKLGYINGEYIYNEAGRKVAYIHENTLEFENGNPAVPVQHVNEHVLGTQPVLMKCAVHVLFEE
jgi:hypothetical protein